MQTKGDSGHKQTVLCHQRGREEAKANGEGHTHMGQKIHQRLYLQEKGTRSPVLWQPKSIMLQLCATHACLPDKNLLNRCVLVIKSST